MFEIACRQHGIVTRAQATASGLTRSMISRRLQSGRLRRVHPGVFALGGTVRTLEQRSFAAVAWGGPGIVASHRTAGQLWGIAGCCLGEIEISGDRRLTRPPPRIAPHFTKHLPHADRWTLRGIPITSPARTLFDLAAVVPEDTARGAIEDAVVKGLVAPGRLLAVIDSAAGRGRRGIPCARRARGEMRGDRLSSRLEDQLEGLLQRERLTGWVREHRIQADGSVFLIDFAWPHARVGIEADSRRWHSTSESFARDRRKHNVLIAHGWTILRFTWSDVFERPDWVTDSLLRALDRASAQRTT